jgi:hypothetical protein
MEAAQVVEGVAATDSKGDNVIDLPSVFRLLAVVRPPNEIPVVIDASDPRWDALNRLTAGPGGDLLLFSPRELG